MIQIVQKKAKKVVGGTSLFVTFSYNEQVIDTVKKAENAKWLKSTKEWELPLNKLSYLIDNLTYIDDIQLDLLKEEISEEIPLTLTHKLEPFEYQEDGIKWLINTKNGLLLDPP